MKRFCQKVIFEMFDGIENQIQSVARRVAAFSL